MTVRNKIEEGTFLDLSHAFWHQKWLILMITAGVTLLSALYIFTRAPVYEAKVLIGPPPSIEASFLNVNPFFYLKALGEKEFDAADLYILFSSYLRSPVVKQLFLDRSHFTSLKKINLMEDPRFKQPKFIVNVKSTSASDAKKQLNAYVAFVNQQASGALTQIMMKRKQTMEEAFLQQIKLLKEVEAASRKTRKIELQKNLPALSEEAKQVIVASPNLASELIQIYEKNYAAYRQKVMSTQGVALFHFDNEISVSDNIVQSKIKDTLVFGGLVGLMLGFLAAVMRTNRSKTKHDNLWHSEKPLPL